MATNIAFYTDRLAQKEQELNELQSAFYKYKLKTKVKLDQLRKEVLSFCNDHGCCISENENHALLLIRVTESEAVLEASHRETEFLRKEVSRKQKQLNDQLILIKNLEEQIRVSQPLSPLEIQERKRAAQMIDMDRVHQQIMFKDERIVELNNMILDKERQILDLQELCREQGEVASVTSQAARIVQRQWEEKNRERREIGTETDASWWNPAQPYQREVESRGRSDSPGRAVASRGTANTSPPPLDPSEVLERTGKCEDICGISGSSNFFLLKSPELDSTFRKKNRKRVTFDLLSESQQQSARISSADQFTNVALELSSENDRLQKELLETTAFVEQLRNKITESDADMSRVLREGKAQALKVRVVTQARIKELEDRIAEMSEQHTKQVEQLSTEIECLRSTREWEIEQNAQLRDQLNQAKTKNHKLTEELDASEKANREWDIKVSRGEEFLDQLIEDLIEAENVIEFMEQQKHSILDDVDKLKDAIIAQDQLIEILEADIVIYEEHIGILRESLGASKIDHRSLLRSKAFETKLKALEKEKEQINRRCKEDRLRTKALDNKCKVLEQENEKLMAKLCELEMRERDESDMSETCRQLEQRIVEVEEKAALNQAECELRLETARLEAERKESEMVRLLEELLTAQQEITRRDLLSERQMDDPLNSSGSNYYVPAGLNGKEERINVANEHRDLVQLREKEEQVNFLEVELEQLKVKYAQVSEELDRMHCTNFELMTKVTTLNESLGTVENEKESWRDMYEKATLELSQKDNEKIIQSEKEAAIEAELSETKVQLKGMREQALSLEKEVALVRTNLIDAEASLASHQVDLGDYKERIDRLEEELFAAKSELDNARLGLQETTAVKKELEHLKEELEHERSSGRAKWEEVCRKVFEYESNPSQSRKNSLEVINKVQHLEYMTAFEEKITCLEKALQEAKNKIEEDKVEKKKLKSALRQLRDNMKEKDKLVQNHHSIADIQQNVARDEVVQVSTEPTPHPPYFDMGKLQDTIKTLELENRLSRELNTEYSHTMLEMEKEVITLKAQISTLQEESKHFEMELKLHEILEEELEKELSQARLKNEEMCNAMNTYEETLEHLNEQVNNDTLENDTYLKALTVEVTDLREQNTLLNEKLASTSSTSVNDCDPEMERQTSDLDKAHSDEVKKLSCSLRTGSHNASDVQMQLTLTESSFAEDQKHAREPKKVDGDSLDIQFLANPSHLDAKSMQQTVVHGTVTPTFELATQVHIEESKSLMVPDGHEESSAETIYHVNQFSPTSQPSPEEARDVMPVANVSTPENLFAENLVLRQCVNESNQMHKDLAQDIGKMWLLKSELENTVEALKGEIWTLNSQLKASILDREQLQDRVVQLDSSLEAEKKRADTLDCELSEQTELTEKATRQAAEAENESNRRLAECLEMETRREHLEKAYAQLSDYYTQLQAAYNVIYAQVKQLEKERENDGKLHASASFSSNIDDILIVVDKMVSELNLELNSDIDLHGKILLIQNTFHVKLSELEDHQIAILEYRRTNEALHEQLRCLEEETQKVGGESRDTKARLLKVEGDLQWKEDECISLRRRVDVLQTTINQLISRHEESSAAKLATRQADVDALFRANAELVHTNVRLQNELDDNEDRMSNTPLIEELQTELSKLRLNERSLLQQLSELKERLGEAEGKLNKSAFEEKAQCMLEAEAYLEEHDVSQNRLPTEAEHPPLLPFSTELNVNELTELRNEVKRLEAVEKLLNERIMCLEDQLLEGEERLQELEDELADERQKAYQRTSELELQIEQKVCAQVDAEKELIVLRERLNNVEHEKRKTRTEEDGWGAEVPFAEKIESELASERDRRKEAEVLACNLRALAATLRVQIDNIQEKWMEEIQKVEEKQAEIEKLQSVIASRTELQQAEHQRSESELETLCEERRRVQDELTSAENEKIRLEEQLISSKMICDKLKTELQLQKGNYAELINMYDDMRKCYEDTQATLLALGAEKTSLLERLEGTERELVELHSQLKSRAHEKEVEQQLANKLKDSENQLVDLQCSLKEVQRELEEKEMQNNLLKDSETRLLESVDEYGLQAEKYKEEVVRLKKIVDVLKKERVEREKKLDIPTKQIQNRLISRSTSITSPTDFEECLLTDQQLESVTAERDELRSRLHEAESRLIVSIQEKLSLTRSYEQLRSRLAARRQAVVSAEHPSQRSSVGDLEAVVPEQPHTVKEPALLSPVPYTSQVADSDVVRRRSGHH